MKKLNIGCGRKQIAGFINVDHNDFGQQLILDLENDVLPFEDSEVDAMRADHFLEHLSDCRHLLNEAWRVLKPEGEFEIYVPYGLWDRQFSPVHKQTITEYWFMWLTKNDNMEYYGYQRWNIKYIKVAERDNGQKFEIHCVLTPFK